MSTKTNCDKCIFADFADSENPCAMGVLEHISDKKTITTGDSGFLSISQFRCPFAFSTEVYKNHQQNIGSIDDLKHQLIKRATIDYYLIAIVTEDGVGLLCENIKKLTVKPKFVSVVLKSSNNTASVIQTLNTLTTTAPWKLHNILEDNPSQQDILDIVISTNTNIQNVNYLWINTETDMDQWDKNIISINKTIVLEQPTLHAMFRTKDKDGLFIGLHNYQQLIKDKQTNIISAIESLNPPLLHYYA